MKRTILFLILLPLALAAQQYSLDDLISHGLANSWSMQRSELSYLSSNSSLVSAKLNLLPEADLGFRVTDQLYNPLAPSVSDLSSSAGFSVSKTISLNDPAWFNYKYARLDAEKASLTRTQSVSAFAYQVFGAYLEVLSAQKQLASLNRNLEIQNRVWEQNKALFELGKNTAWDVKQSEIAVMNSRIDILRQENTITTRRRELFSLVNLADAGHELADLAPDAGYRMPAYSAEQSAEVKLLKADIRRVELAKRQSTLDYFPRVSLGYNFSRDVSGPDFELDSYDTNHTVSLNLSYSLWNLLRQGQTVKRSGLSLRQAELQLQDKLGEIDRQYATLAQELQYLTNLDALYRENLSQSSEQIRIAEERYRLGLIELLELDKTRTEYISADIAYNNNRYQILAKQEAINHLLSHKILGKW